MLNLNKPIVITTGESAGIGMDIVLLLVADGFFKNLDMPVIVLACNKAVHDRAKQLLENGSLKIMPTWSKLEVVDGSESIEIDKLCHHQADFILYDVATTEQVIPGVINIANSSMVLKQLEIAHKLAYDGKVAGVVTAPLQKSALIAAKLTLPDSSMFSGHTEYFMQMSGCSKVVMMLANSKLRVALVTTHLPLSAVSQAITKQEVRSTMQIVLDSLQTQFNLISPKVLVCGLNPHAGEGGCLGMEEIEVINPVLQEFQQQGYDVSDAMPADTLYTPYHLRNCDATVAMYHDQGLPVLKSHGFGDSVNITLGLPYIRTSVDHGTALDRAGTGNIDVNSMKQAIQILKEMSSTAVASNVSMDT